MKRLIPKNQNPSGALYKRTIPYSPTKEIRKKIAEYEGIDFLKLNTLFGGDAIEWKYTNKVKKHLGDLINDFTDDELDSILSYAYNIGDGKNWLDTILAIKNFHNNPNSNTYNDIRNSFKAGYGKLKGLTKRRDEERSRFNRYPIVVK